MLVYHFNITWIVDYLPILLHGQRLVRATHQHRGFKLVCLLVYTIKRMKVYIKTKIKLKNFLMAKVPRVSLFKFPKGTCVSLLKRFGYYGRRYYRVWMFRGSKVTWVSLGLVTWMSLGLMTQVALHYY